MFEADKNPQSTNPGGYRSDAPILVNGVTRSVTGLSETGVLLFESAGSCGLESVFGVAVGRFLSISLGGSGVVVGFWTVVSAGTGTGTGVGAGNGVGLGTGVCVGLCACAGAGAGSETGVGVGSGLSGTGGGETKAVLSAFSLARACAAASLSAFCCFKMRSTVGGSSQWGRRNERRKILSPLYPRLRKARRSVDNMVMNNKASLTLYVWKSRRHSEVATS